ncbi:MAG: hypothetical protein IKY18_06205 [Oscillospiraceae bacterium]|nr:hypothetical protein [Oscillospiraceae bacterium]
MSFKVDGETKSVSQYVRVDNITKPGITLENGKVNVEMYNYEFSKAYVFYLSDAASVNTNNWTQVKDAAAKEQNNPYASTTKNGFMTYRQSSKKNHKDAIYLPNVAALMLCS